MAQLRRGKNLLFARLLQPSVPYIHVCIPEVVIILQDSEARPVLGPRQIFDGLYLVRKFCDFPKFPVIPVIIVQNPMPVNLRPYRTGTPAEETNIIRSMSDTLHRPERHLPRLRRRSFHPCIPSICPGLLLHNPKMRADGTHP